MAECVGVAVIRAADRYIFGGAINAEGAETFYSEPAGGNGRAPKYVSEYRPVMSPLA